MKEIRSNIKAYPPASLVETGAGAGNTAPRVFLYVDGFNVYYTSLKNNPHVKWLDYYTLVSKLFKNANIVGIKYFTAKIKNRENDKNQANRQNVYINALKKHTENYTNIDIIYGHFLKHKVMMKTVNPPPDFTQVWKTEEKGSDVNLAVHMLNDAWANKYDIALLLTNDSDLAEPMRLVKKLNKKVCWLKQDCANKPSYELRKNATFIKTIRIGLLEASQLPEKIPNTNLYRPKSWQ